jgi:hypothetical protein
MTSLYFITLHNKVFNTRIQSRTCLIGITEKATARRVKKVLERSHGIPNLKVSGVDYMRDEFYEMLKLNQFTLMVASDVDFLENSFELNGDVVDSPKVTYNELVDHLEKLYVQHYPKY